MDTRGFSSSTHSDPLSETKTGSQITASPEVQQAFAAVINGPRGTDEEIERVRSLLKDHLFSIDPTKSPEDKQTVMLDQVADGKKHSVMYRIEKIKTSATASALDYAYALVPVIRPGKLKEDGIGMIEAGYEAHTYWVMMGHVRHDTALRIKEWNDREDVYEICQTPTPTVLEKGKLYLSEKNGHIAYSVVIPSGVEVHDIPTPIEPTSSSASIALDAILEATSNAGHTKKAYSRVVLIAPKSEEWREVVTYLRKNASGVLEPFESDTLDFNITYSSWERTWHTIKLGFWNFVNWCISWVSSATGSRTEVQSAVGTGSSQASPTSSHSATSLASPVVVDSPHLDSASSTEAVSGSFSPSTRLSSHAKASQGMQTQARPIPGAHHKKRSLHFTGRPRTQTGHSFVSTTPPDSPGYLSSSFPESTHSRNGVIQSSEGGRVLQLGNRSKGSSLSPPFSLSPDGYRSARTTGSSTPKHIPDRHCASPAMH